VQAYVLFAAKHAALVVCVLAVSINKHITRVIEVCASADRHSHKQWRMKTAAAAAAAAAAAGGGGWLRWCQLLRFGNSKPWLPCALVLPAQASTCCC
jgi:hypothetical protein